MKEKLVALSLPQQQKWDKLIASFQKLFINLQTNIQSASKNRKENFPAELNSYSNKLTEVEEMIKAPSVANIIALISSLKRNLPRITYEYWFFMENHMAQLELISLVVNLKACWKDLTEPQIEILTKFLTEKTIITLDSDANCLGKTLKWTVDGLVEFQPQLETSLGEIIAIRNEHLKSKNK